MNVYHIVDIVPSNTAQREATPTNLELLEQSGFAVTCRCFAPHTMFAGATMSSR